MRSLKAPARSLLLHSLKLYRAIDEIGHVLGRLGGERVLDVPRMGRDAIRHLPCCLELSIRPFRQHLDLVCVDSGFRFAGDGSKERPVVRSMSMLISLLIWRRKLRHSLFQINARTFVLLQALNKL